MTSHPRSHSPRKHRRKRSSLDDIAVGCKELRIDRNEPAWDYSMSTTAASRRKVHHHSVAEDLTCGGQINFASSFVGDVLSPIPPSSRRRKTSYDSRSRQKSAAIAARQIQVTEEERLARALRRERLRKSAAARYPILTDAADASSRRSLSTSGSQQSISPPQKAVRLPSSPTNVTSDEPFQVGSQDVIETVNEHKQADYRKTTSSRSHSSRRRASGSRPPRAPMCVHPGQIVAFDHTMADLNAACDVIFPLNFSRAPTPPTSSRHSRRQHHHRRRRRADDDVHHQRPKVITCTIAADDSMLDKSNRSRRKSKQSSSSSPRHRTRQDTDNHLSQSDRGKSVKKHVRFTRPFVTEIHTRPKTDPDDIPELFFCEDELWEMEKDRLNRIYEEQVECIAMHHPESKRLLVSVAFPSRQQRRNQTRQDVAVRQWEDKDENAPKKYMHLSDDSSSTTTNSSFIKISADLTYRLLEQIPSIDEGSSFTSSSTTPPSTDQEEVVNEENHVDHPPADTEQVHESVPSKVSICEEEKKEEHNESIGNCEDVTGEF